MTQDELIVNTLYDAISEFEHKHPNAIQIIFKEVTTENCYEDKYAIIFSEACAAVVEPDVYLKKMDKNMQLYYDICEEDHMSFTKQQIRNREENVDAWLHLIDILNINGY
jgi:hypothetical protein